MTEQNAPSAKNKSAASKEDRLKAALKANLARRKSQAKARRSVEQSENTDTKE